MIRFLNFSYLLIGIISMLYLHSNKIKGEQGFEWKKLALSVSYQNEFRVILEGIVSVTLLKLYTLKNKGKPDVYTSRTKLILKN